MIEIKPDIYYVGVKNPDMRIFDVFFKTESGTTYNSYLIVGKEKIALIDTVKEPFRDEFIKNIEEIVPLEKINYIITLHHEPDHSGALKYILEKSNARVVISKTAGLFLKQILHRDANPLLVGDNDKISLGNITLEFIQAPFLHWPDTMFAYIPERNILFTCDFLGQHFSDEEIYNDESRDFTYAFEHYYKIIMRPFKDYVLQAIKKIENKNIDMIAPSHGMILRKDPWKYVDLYRTWSTPKPRDYRRALVFYASPYGGTGKLANSIAKGLADSGVYVEIFDLAGTVIDDSLLDLIENSDALIVGSSTLNGDAIKPVWDLLSSLTTINMRNKIGFAFGTFAWSGEAPKFIENRLKDLKLKVPETSFRAGIIPTEDDLQRAAEMGKKLAGYIIGPSSSVPA
ncbi:MAG: FprA family A-type flavoprotein [Thermoplasmata archaeon]